MPAPPVPGSSGSSLPPSVPIPADAALQQAAQYAAQAASQQGMTPLQQWANTPIGPGPGIRYPQLTPQQIYNAGYNDMGTPGVPWPDPRRPETGQIIQIVQTPNGPVLVYPARPNPPIGVGSSGFDTAVIPPGTAPVVRYPAFGPNGEWLGPQVAPVEVNPSRRISLPLVGVPGTVVEEPFTPIGGGVTTRPRVPFPGAAPTPDVNPVGNPVGLNWPTARTVTTTVGLPLVVAFGPALANDLDQELLGAGIDVQQLPVPGTPTSPYTRVPSRFPPGVQNFPGGLTIPGRGEAPPVVVLPGRNAPLPGPGMLPGQRNPGGGGVQPLAAFIAPNCLDPAGVLALRATFTDPSGTCNGAVDFSAGQNAQVCAGNSAWGGFVPGSGGPDMTLCCDGTNQWLLYAMGSSFGPWTPIAATAAPFSLAFGFSLGMADQHCGFLNLVFTKVDGS